MRGQPNVAIRLRRVTLAAMTLAWPLHADTFFWTGQSSTSWTNSASWTGPEGEYPNWWSDVAYVNGAVNNPIVNTNIVIGFLVIQNGGHVTAGGNDPLSSLGVTSNGNQNGLALIKHAGSRLTVFGSTNYRDFQCENLKIQNGSTLSMREDATVQVDAQLILQAGGVIEGNGEFDFSQTDGNLDPYNDGLIQSNLGTLRFYNSGNSVAVLDIDGPSENGLVEVSSNSSLIIDTDIETEFNGEMMIGPVGELQINTDWTLASDAGSILNFNGGGIYEQRAILSGAHATFLGDVSVLSGIAALAAPATFGNGVDVILGNGTTLHVENTLDIAANAAVTGSGALSVSDGAHLSFDSSAIVNVMVQNHGVTTVVSEGLGLALVKSFEQTDTGRVEFDLCDQDGGEEIVERLVISTNAALDGELNLTAMVGCEPSPGDEFVIISAGSITGEFLQVSGLTDVEVLYDATTVTVRIPLACAADFDGDGVVDINDLLTLLGGWGTPAGDLDDDDDTDINDLLVLLGSWGQCV